MEKYIIVGAGGHAKVIIDILRQNNINNIRLLDDYKTGNLLGCEIIGKISEAYKYNECQFVVALGDNKNRENFVKSNRLKYGKAIHPTAVIAENVIIEEGTVICANATINSSANIGRHVIINTAAIVEHDCIVGNFVHISPGARIGGTVQIGERCWIGIGATIINNIKISDNILLGAGAVCIEDLERSGKYVGIPARIIKYK